MVRLPLPLPPAFPFPTRPVLPPPPPLFSPSTPPHPHRAQQHHPLPQGQPKEAGRRGRVDSTSRYSTPRVHSSLLVSSPPLACFVVCRVWCVVCVVCVCVCRVVC